jgi:hypothetical protein
MTHLQQLENFLDNLQTLHVAKRQKITCAYNAKRIEFTNIVKHSELSAAEFDTHLQSLLKVGKIRDTIPETLHPTSALQAICQGDWVCSTEDVAESEEQTCQLFGISPHMIDEHLEYDMIEIPVNFTYTMGGYKFRDVVSVQADEDDDQVDVADFILNNLDELSLFTSDKDQPTINVDHLASTWIQDAVDMADGFSHNFGGDIYDGPSDSARTTATIYVWKVVEE